MHWQCIGSASLMYSACLLILPLLRCSPFTDAPAIHEFVLSAIFLVDMVLKFRLAFREHEQLVGDPKRIRQRYMR